MKYYRLSLFTTILYTIPLIKAVDITKITNKSPYTVTFKATCRVGGISYFDETLQSTQFSLTNIKNHTITLVPLSNYTFGGFGYYPGDSCIQLDVYDTTTKETAKKIMSTTKISYDRNPDVIHVQTDSKPKKTYDDFNNQVIITVNIDGSVSVREP